MNPYSNPYAPPQAAELYDAPVAGPGGNTGVVPDAIVEQLRGTRPWVIFLAIVGFLFSGLCAVMGIGVMAVGAIGPLKGAGKEALPMAIAGLVYLILGVVYIPPCVGLIRYGSAIGGLIRDPRIDLLGAALNHQRRFWKTIGIMTAVMIALYPIGIVVAVAVVVLKVK